jgi:hypothetical protein
MHTHHSVSAANSIVCRNLSAEKFYWGGNNPDSLIVRGSANAGFMADTIVWQAVLELFFATAAGIRQ